MNFIPLSIPDVIVIEPRVFQDPRGFFLETYQFARFAANGIPAVFVQDNHSGSIQNTLRGLHYQIQQVQGKLVRASVGEIFDVAVDLRKKSPTFGKWVGTYLSGENRRQLWIPGGFAHGFYAVSQWVEVIYKATDNYAPQHERTLLWNDPTVGIEWPLPSDTQPLISPKDAQGTSFSACDCFEN
jgi:dTDP-4-dehydrorhamnose 3,5-epimerase